MPDLLRVSPATAIGIAIYPPGATYGPRVMREFEFVWMIEGDAEYRWGDRVVAAPQGSVVLCRPGRDFFRWDPRRRTRHGYFHFHVRASPRAWGAASSWPLVRDGVEGDVLRPLFQHLLAWHGTGDVELERLTVAHMLRAFVAGQHASGSVPVDPLPDPVERALAHLHAAMERDPAAPIPLADLADAAHVTPEHLCRLFGNSIGRSPVETVRLARLDRAAALVTRSNYSLKEIAEQLGFAGPFHLSRRFKEAFGRSPRDVRKAVAAGETPPLPTLLRSGIKGRRTPGR